MGSRVTITETRSLNGLEATVGAPGGGGCGCGGGGGAAAATAAAPFFYLEQE